MTEPIAQRAPRGPDSPGPGRVPPVDDRVAPPHKKSPPKHAHASHYQHGTHHATSSHQPPHRTARRFAKNAPTHDGVAHRVISDDREDTSLIVARLDMALRAAAKDGRPIVIVFGDDAEVASRALVARLQAQGNSVVYVEGGHLGERLQFSKQFGSDLTPESPLTIVVPPGTQAHVGAIVDSAIGPLPTLRLVAKGKQSAQLAKSRLLIGTGTATQQALQTEVARLGFDHAPMLAQTATHNLHSDTALPSTSHPMPPVQLGNNALLAPDGVALEAALQGNVERLIISAPANECSQAAAEKMVQRYRNAGMTTPIIVVPRVASNMAATQRLLGGAATTTTGWSATLVHSNVTNNVTTHAVAHVQTIDGPAPPVVAKKSISTWHAIVNFNKALRAAAHTGRPIVVVFGDPTTYVSRVWANTLERDGSQVVFVTDGRLEKHLRHMKQFAGGHTLTAPMTCVLPSGTRAYWHNHGLHFTAPRKVAHVARDSLLVAGISEAKRQFVHDEIKRVDKSRPAPPIDTKITTPFPESMLPLGNNALAVQTSEDLELAMRGKDAAMIITVPNAEFDLATIELLVAQHRTNNNLPIIVVRRNTRTTATLHQLFGADLQLTDYRGTRVTAFVPGPV